MGKAVMRGENVLVRVLINDRVRGNPEVFSECSVEENSDIHQDDYIGNKRSVPDKTINGYTMKLKGDVDSLDLEAAIAEQDLAREERRPVPDLKVLCIFENRDGVDETWVLRGERSVGKLGINWSGRKDAVKRDGEITAQYWEKVS